MASGRERPPASSTEEGGSNSRERVAASVAEWGIWERAAASPAEWGFRDFATEWGFQGGGWIITSASVIYRNNPERADVDGTDWSNRAATGGIRGTMTVQTRLVVLSDRIDRISKYSDQTERSSQVQ